MRIDRKTFLQNLSLATGAALLPDFTQADPLFWKKPKMQLGFVTYLWGKDWDVPTLIKNLSDTPHYRCRTTCGACPQGYARPHT
jgi:hypothetical protein